MIKGRFSIDNFFKNWFPFLPQKAKTHRLELC